MTSNRSIPSTDDLRRITFGERGAAEVTALADAAPDRHGRRQEWETALRALPDTPTGWRIDDGVLVAGEPVAESAALAETLKGLIPWRKGPLRLGGVAIDTEWRSDWKWDRVAPHVRLADQPVLDIGAGNGYFAWRMLDAGAGSVTACDPTLVFWMQHRAISHFAGPAPVDLLPLPFESLPARAHFGTAFSMGVLYHRRDPLEHLARIHAHLVPGGTLVLETLVLPGDGNEEFDPPDRYANMRNVHRLPTVRRLLDWLDASGFSSVRCVDLTATTPAEQRPTDWMPFHSLAHALSPDASRTVEGHPPPLRATIVARSLGPSD